MKLHRTTGAPDWQTIDPVDQNIWQRVAVATQGVVTPGNVITMIGLALVVWGLVALLQDNYWLAGALVLVGRFCDLLDGWAADATGTKSPLGEFVDAAIDKLETGAAFGALLISQLLPWWVVVLLVIPQVLITGIALAARRRHIELHPSRRGKLGMALVWVLIVGLVALRVAGIHMPLIELIAALLVLFETLLVAREYRQQLDAK